MQRKSIHELARVQNTQSNPSTDLATFPALADLPNVPILEIEGLPTMIDIEFAQDYAVALAAFMVSESKKTHN